MSLTRVTVNLIPKADAALEQAVRLTGYSKTDTINRALQLYAYILDCHGKGEEIFVKKGESLEKVILL